MINQCRVPFQAPEQYDIHNIYINIYILEISLLYETVTLQEILSDNEFAWWFVSTQTTFFNNAIRQVTGLIPHTEGTVSADSPVTISYAT